MDYRKIYESITSFSDTEGLLDGRTIYKIDTKEQLEALIEIRFHSHGDYTVDGESFGYDYSMKCLMDKKIPYSMCVRQFYSEHEDEFTIDTEEVLIKWHKELGEFLEV